MRGKFTLINFNIKFELSRIAWKYVGSHDRSANLNFHGPTLVSIWDWFVFT